MDAERKVGYKINKNVNIVGKYYSISENLAGYHEYSSNLFQENMSKFSAR